MPTKRRNRGGWRKKSRLHGWQEIVEVVDLLQGRARHPWKHCRKPCLLFTMINLLLTARKDRQMHCTNLLARRHSHDQNPSPLPNLWAVEPLDQGSTSIHHRIPMRPHNQHIIPEYLLHLIQSLAEAASRCLAWSKPSLPPLAPRSWSTGLEGSVHQ